MRHIKTLPLLTALLPLSAFCQHANAYKPDYSEPKAPTGYTLAWHDEFNNTGKPDSTNWTYEKGFVRNQELQWYQPDNANCKKGVLLIEGRKEKAVNPNYKEGSSSWRQSRQYAEYTSACIETKGLQQFSFGRFEIRARIDTSIGAWPAIWTLGIKGPWPDNGEIDQMEFYRVNNVPTILANFAWGSGKPYKAKWNSKRTPLSHFLEKDKHWPEKFHVWRMGWSKDSISIYLDDELLNTSLPSQTLNADSTNPFLQPQFLLLNMALGQNGGDPATAKFPIKYEVDYVRYYKKDGE